MALAMREQLHYYNIHDIVKVRSEVPLQELEYFSSDAFHNSDMIISVTDSLPPGMHFRRKLVEHGFGKRKVSYTEHFGALGAQFAVDFANPIEISVNRLISRSRHVLYVNLVEPIMRFLMISKGYILLHSACIAMNGHGVLLSAPPDTGKTTTVLKCIKTGFSFLSDDMTIIHLPNEAISFPKSMTISAHTLKTVTSLSNNGFNKIGLKLRSLAHSKEGRGFMRRLGDYNVPIFTINTIAQSLVKPPKFKIEHILQSVNFQDRTKVQGLYFLQSGGEETLKIPPDIALTQAIEYSDDAFLFPPYRELLHYIKIGGKPAKDLLEVERKMLERFLSGLDSFIIKSDSKSWYQKVNGIADHSLA